MKKKEPGVVFNNFTRMSAKLRKIRRGLFAQFFTKTVPFLKRDLEEESPFVNEQTQDDQDSNFIKII